MKIKDIIPQYISYRQALGKKFRTNTTELKCFLKYAGEESEFGDLDLDVCTSFLYAPSGKVTANWFCKYTALKGLFQWAMVRGHINEIPLPVDKPKRPPGTSPYIYSDEELNLLFSTALTFQKNRSHIYPECIRMILMLTYMLGLRLHETVALPIKAIDWNNSLIQINESKFYKSRIVPFNNKVKELLAEFMVWRKENGQPDDVESHLFLDRKNTPVHINTVRECFKRIRSQANISREDNATYQPRIHDLRHTFAVNRLISWYRQGEDVQKLLPILSTYLGHKHLSHTSVYLTMTGNLLEEANKRFETYVNRETHE